MCKSLQSKRSPKQSQVLTTLLLPQHQPLRLRKVRRYNQRKRLSLHFPTITSRSLLIKYKIFWLQEGWIKRRALVSWRNGWQMLFNSNNKNCNYPNSHKFSLLRCNSSLTNTNLACLWCNTVQCIIRIFCSRLLRRHICHIFNRDHTVSPNAKCRQ